ncbi:Rne/Rng family ribonuclease [Neorickettsia findlayensis]|uniref:Rne/Rng family ribonuclease n=1 Tax=Neorickettsia findlayensis TaxID=2686014 RepID=A0A6P1G9R6_9RICK|nr:Rne/Rng family ribonuclease [Neorickettsia findlayensis]QHD64944.1 Rne/Rng family ribonuclease [Neorickettsia findlayensis]
MKKILIDSREGETRLAILRGGLLVGYDCEHTTNLPQKGNIYLGVIFKVDDSLQAAFVEYLPGEYGFLPFSEIPVVYFDLLEEVKANAIAEGKHVNLYKHFNATEVVKKGLVLFVQVTKEKRRAKDVTLTAYVKLPGRYCVLMPFLKDLILSKQIVDEQAVSRLTRFAEEEMADRKYGVVFKSYCANADKKNVLGDYCSLLSEWEKVVLQSDKSKAPRLVFREANLVKKFLRDSYDGSVGEVIVNHSDVYREAKDYIQNSLHFENPNITLYSDTFPVFDKYKVEPQVESLYEETIYLRNGGYIVINGTEALTAVDVNSGRMKKESNIEETAYKVNMEAVAEIVRHLELRGIAGIVVIDFIDMNNSKYMLNVEKALQDAFKRYRARVQIAPINKFGLIALSKQRTKHNILDSHTVKCPYCEGKGKVLKLEHQVRKVFSAIYSAPRCREVIVTANPELAIAIFNGYRKMLAQAEEVVGGSIVFKIDEKLGLAKGFEIAFHEKDDLQILEEDQAVITVEERADEQTVKKGSAVVKVESRRSWLASWIKKLTGL